MVGGLIRSILSDNKTQRLRSGANCAEMCRRRRRCKGGATAVERARRPSANKRRGKGRERGSASAAAAGAASNGANARRTRHSDNHKTNLDGDAPAGAERERNRRAATWSRGGRRVHATWWRTTLFRPRTTLRLRRRALPGPMRAASCQSGAAASGGNSHSQH